MKKGIHQEAEQLSCLILTRFLKGKTFPRKGFDPEIFYRDCKYIGILGGTL